MDKPHLDKYLASGGRICPYCNGDYLEGLSEQLEDEGTIEREVRCFECRKCWIETFELVHAEEDNT